MYCVHVRVLLSITIKTPNPEHWAHQSLLSRCALTRIDNVVHPQAPPRPSPDGRLKLREIPANQWLLFSPNPFTPYSFLLLPSNTHILLEVKIVRRDPTREASPPALGEGGLPCPSRAAELNAASMLVVKPLPKSRLQSSFHPYTTMNHTEPRAKPAKGGRRCVPYVTRQFQPGQDAQEVCTSALAMASVTFSISGSAISFFSVDSTLGLAAAVNGLCQYVFFSFSSLLFSHG